MSGESGTLMPAIARAPRRSRRMSPALPVEAACCISTSLDLVIGSSFPDQFGPEQVHRGRNVREADCPFLSHSERLESHDLGSRRYRGTRPMAASISSEART